MSQLVNAHVMAKGYEHVQQLFQALHWSRKLTLPLLSYIPNVTKASSPGPIPSFFQCPIFLGIGSGDEASVTMQ